MIKISSKRELNGSRHPSEDAEKGIHINFTNHHSKDCKVCRYGPGHGRILDDYLQDRKSTNFSIIMNLVAIFTVGTCPSIPWVFAQAGWCGVLLIIFIGWLNWLGSKYLVSALYCVPGHRLYDFTALATHFFGLWVGKFVRIISHLIEICTVGVLVVSILDNMNLFLNYLGFSNVVTDHFKLSTFLAIVSIAIPGYFIRTMDDTTVTSFIGNLNIISICIVCIVQCRPDYKTHSPIYHSIKPRTIVNGFNFVLFCFSGLLNFPHVERTMKEPKNWNRAVAYSILIACFSFILIGIMGYWAYGDAVAINFYVNLPQTWVVIFLTVMFVVQAYTTCLVSMILVVDEERPRLKDKLKTNIILSQAIYILVHCFPYLVMWSLIIGIRFFDTFTNLTGSISGVYFSIVLPVVYYVLSYGLKPNLFTFNGFCMVLMVVFGLTLGNYFIYVSFIELLKRAQH